MVGTAPLEADHAIDRSDQAECMIEAHEALVDADPENLARFKDVLEYLNKIFVLVQNSLIQCGPFCS